MTECNQPELRFPGPNRREIVARFDGGDITSDAGVLLVGDVDRRTRILERFAACFHDHRRAERVEHSVKDLVAQRVMGLALGYEDLVDHDELRHDPLLAAVVGKKDPKGRRRRERYQGKALATSSTLNRLELSRPESAAEDRYHRIALDQEQVDRLLVDVFLEAHETAPERIVLDLDATDDPLHGNQEGRFFHGYYRCYCYLPLYIFSGDHLLCARLRRSNIDAATGSREELERIVGQIREAWPEVEIVVRADSGFCREWLMAWCEENSVEYVLGLARNPRLEERIASHLEDARDFHEISGEPERIFASFQHSTIDSWTRMRRVVAKAEHLAKGPNPRFVVTSLEGEEWTEEVVYEELYCARGDMENRIKEQQLYLFADRTSAHTMLANQVRLNFSSVAYLLLDALRRLGLAGTELARAQCHTIRLKLLKIGARVKVTVRRVWVHMSESYPYAALFARVWRTVRVT